MLKSSLISLALCLLCAVTRSQELPSVFPNETTPSVRHNFCDLHRTVESGNATRRRILEGMELHVALFTYQLDKDTGGIKEPPGIAEKFLDELAERAGFTWRNSYGTVSSPSGNETWSSVLTSSVSTYDLLGDWYLRTIDRLNQGIVFPESWYDGSLIMVRTTAEVSDQFSFLSFLRPFTAGLWAIIVAITLISGIIMHLLEMLDDKRHSNQMMKFSLSESLFGAAFLFIGHFSGHPRSNATRILSFSLCFFYLILTAAYTANLASFLVVKNSPDVVVNTVNDAIKHDQSFCVLDSSTSDKFLSENYPSARLVKKDTIDDTYNSVQSGECDIVLTTVDTFETKRRTIEFNSGCNLEWVGRKVKNIDAGFTMRDSETHCSSLLRDVIDMHMIEMKATGRFDELWNDHKELKTTNSCAGDGNESNSNEDEDDPRINLKNSAGIIIVHICATVIAIIVSLVQYKRKAPPSGTNKNIGTAEYIAGQPKAPVDFRRSQLRASVGRDVLAARQYRNTMQNHNLIDGANNCNEDVQEDFIEDDNFDNEDIQRKPRLSLIQEDEESASDEKDKEQSIENPPPKRRTLTMQEQQLNLLNQMFLEMAANDQRQQDEMKEMRESISEIMKMKSSMDESMKQIAERSKTVNGTNKDQDKKSVENTAPLSSPDEDEDAKVKELIHDIATLAGEK